MTEEQKQAISILNQLKGALVLMEEPAIDEDEYFLLLSFIINEHE